eukprot:1182117-Prorocentrum_minimum.AAC.4
MFVYLYDVAEQQLAVERLDPVCLVVKHLVSALNLNATVLRLDKSLLPINLWRGKNRGCVGAGRRHRYILSMGCPSLGCHSSKRCVIKTPSRLELPRFICAHVSGREILNHSGANPYHNMRRCCAPRSVRPPPGQASPASPVPSAPGSPED